MEKYFLHIFPSLARSYSLWLNGNDLIKVIDSLNTHTDRQPPPLALKEARVPYTDVSIPTGSISRLYHRIRVDYVSIFVQINCHGNGIDE